VGSILGDYCTEQKFYFIIFKVIKILVSFHKRQKSIGTLEYFISLYNLTFIDLKMIEHTDQITIVKIIK